MENIVSHFVLDGDVINISPYGNGHINVTYLVVTTKNKYILQKINTYVFRDVDLLMNNINYVTNFLSSVHVETLEIIKTRDNALFYKNEDGAYRMYQFVLSSVTHEKASSLEMVYLTGKAFGQFHKSLSNINVSALKEVIPDFHNTPKRFDNFIDALNVSDSKKQFTCVNEIKYVLSQKNNISLITEKLGKGCIPLSVTHNDPKINNILFDGKTDAVRCVIDLDTIMPGSVLYDFGDALRSLFTGENESSEDLSKLVVDYDIFKNYVSGYLSEMNSVLNQSEINLLPYAPYILTLECGIRFLEDYLRGNVYFHINYENENLIRARTQFHLAKDILKNVSSLTSIVNDCITAKSK